MKNFINTENKEIVYFDKNDLPMVIHGRDKTGSSLFSITMAAHLHIQGNKLLIFTAYPMAKEEFLEQVGNDSSVFYLENSDDINKAQEYQTIIIKSGDIGLCAYTIKNLNDTVSRILFIKNVDIMLNNEIVENLKINNSIMLSGDVDLSIYPDFIKNINYKTKIFFSESKIFSPELITLEKYQACIIKDNLKFVASIS